jgi:hypothetical protein
MQSSNYQPEPWSLHRDTLEALDPLCRMVAMSYIERGIWSVIDEG